MRRDQAIRTKAYRALIRYRSPEELFKMHMRRVNRTVQLHGEEVEEYRQKMDVIAVQARALRMMMDAQLPIEQCQFRDGVAVMHPDLLKELQAEGSQWSPEFIAKMRVMP